MISTILFDIGDTLVHAATAATPVDELEARPTPGALTTLRALSRHHRLGAVTDTSVMSADDVRHALAGTGIDELLEVIVTSADVGAAKPDPRGLRLAIERLDAAPDAVLFVGDSAADAEAAREAGIRFVAVDPDGGIAGPLRSALTDALGGLEAARRLVAPADAAAGRRARAHHDRLTKPRRSLGRLEDLGVALAAIAGVDPPPRPVPAAVAVFAGDHGVVEEGVTPWPQEVTRQMVANIAGGGAAISVLARQAGATVTVIDVGIAGEVEPTPGLRRRRVRSGTANLARVAAMSPDEARAAVEVGIEVANELVEEGAAALVTGEMGIGNTTAAAAVISALTGCAARDVTGRGTGVDDTTLDTKVAIVERAVGRVAPGSGPLDVLAEVGGLEIAALAGFVLGGASHRVPIVVDGVIAGAGLLAAVGLAPEVLDHVVAGHRSTEPGASAVLEHLGIEPVLDLDLRLGEGSGACLALGVLDAAALVLREMATFDAAGVADKVGGNADPATSA